MEIRVLEGKKYSLSDNYVDYDGRRLYQIYTSMPVDICGGCIITQHGGFVESESNLSHEGDCWVDSGCYVYGNARVEGNAIVKCDDNQTPSIIGGKVLIKDNAIVVGSILKGRKVIDGNTEINWNTEVEG